VDNGIYYQIFDKFNTVNGGGYLKIYFDLLLFIKIYIIAVIKQRGSWANPTVILKYAKEDYEKWLQKRN
jgi:hypothetical protein